MYNAHWIHSLPYSKFIELTLFMARALAILLKILQKPPICSWGAKMNPNVEFISFDGQYRDYGVKPNISTFFPYGCQPQQFFVYFWR